MATHIWIAILPILLFVERLIVGRLIKTWGGGGGNTINSKTKLGKKVVIKVRPKENFQICLADTLAAINLPDKICFFEYWGSAAPPAVSPLNVTNTLFSFAVEEF